jgi:formylglycine-generating enzyme required for sulfatase activity/predicted Ser/Thr protein kinase
MNEAPQMLGKYRIVKELGRGSFGAVYLAEDTSLNDRPVALKVLYPQLVVDPETVGLFRQEAGTMAHLDHPHIVTVYEAGDVDGRRFIAMRYVPGRTLAQVLKEEGPQPLERVAGWLEQVASALDYAHERGILHRDVKPGNILLDRDDRAVVTDFGLAKAVSASGGSASSQDREILSGTARYMAPEQAKGKPVVQSDVYSLGVVLYELLTGQVPFDGDDPFAIAIRHMTEEPRSPRELRPDLPGPVEAVVLRALAKQPADRWPSAAEMAGAFRLALEAGERARQEAEARAEARRAEEERKRLEAAERAQRAAEERARQEAEARAEARRAEEERRRREAAERARQEAGARRAARAGVPPWVWAVAAVILLAAAMGLGLVLGGGGKSAPTAVPTRVAGVERPSTTTTIPTSTPQAGATETRSEDGMEMVYVPAGEFLMGSTDANSQAGEDEKPQHTVYLDAFWIDRTEVTNAQYRLCVEAGACRAPTECDWGEPTYDDASKADHPVVCVSWDDARTYCQWAGAWLPTEAEWEKAARGTDAQLYPWGNDWDSNKCNTAEGGVGGTTPVGKYSPAGDSPYGCADMAGNVWEWVNDWYDSSYYSSSPDRNPQAPDSGDLRVLRGGSWGNGRIGARSAVRYWYYPDFRSNYNGYRCVVSPTSSP